MALARCESCWDKEVTSVLAAHCQARVVFAPLYGLVHTSVWNSNRFFTAGMKRSILNTSELTEGSFNAAFFQTPTCLSFYVVRWPHSGWRWQWNTKELTCLRERAAKQPHVRQYSSAVPSKCTHHGSRLQDFWQSEINNWSGEKAGIVQ